MPAIDRINTAIPPNGAASNQNKPDTHEGVIYEPGSAGRDEFKTLKQIREEEAAEAAKAARANLHARFDGPGIEVELSTEAVEAASKPKEQSILDIFRDTLRSIKEFFLSIWNGGNEGTASDAAVKEIAETAETMDTDESAGEAGEGFEEFTGILEAGTKTANPAADIPGTAAEAPTEKANPAAVSSLRPGNIDEAEAFLINYGGRHLAKNSDLLTQYDRRGHIIPVDPSDRSRILQGEGKIRRY